MECKRLKISGSGSVFESIECKFRRECLKKENPQLKYIQYKNSHKPRDRMKNESG
jgi:hypothetical protein